MQHERRQREVVYPVDVARDLDLPLIVRVDLHQHFEPELARALGELADEVEGLRHHERAVTALLDRVADRIEPNHAHAVRGERLQDGVEVPDSLRMLYIDVDLLGRESGPEDAPGAVRQRHRRKWEAGPRPVDRQKILLARAVGKHAIECQEHPVA